MGLVSRNLITASNQSTLSPRQDSPKAEVSPASAALEAYKQGLLGPHYFDDGWKQTVTVEKIPALLRKGFSLQLAENGKFYLTRGLSGGAPNEFISTQALAEELEKTDLKDGNYAAMQELALNVINLFGQHQAKTKSLIDEVTALAYANNTAITKSLLKVLVKEINQGELLDIDLLKSLKTTLINSLIDALDPDDLIQVLQITLKRITAIHQQDKTNYKLYAGVSTISDILDVMGDANVIKVGRIDLHDPLYAILDTLSDHDDTLIAAKAAHAKQSLVRVPNDETKLRSALRHGASFAKGVTSLCKVVMDTDLSSLLSAYENFKKSVDFQEEKREWYGDVRILKLLSEKRDYNLFSQVMDTRIQDTTNPHIVGNILFILHDVTQNDPDVEKRKWALDRMSDLFLNDAKWGDKKEIKKSVLAKFMSCAALPDKATADYAKDVLTSIGDKKDLTRLQGRLIEDVLEDLPKVTSKSEHHVDAPSNVLIKAASHPKVVSPIDHFLEFIEKSKSDPQAAIAASNAITILNTAQVNLGGPNFNRISNHQTRNTQSFISDISISPGGQWALSGSYDETLRLWDCNTGHELCFFFGHSDSVYSVAFSPDGKCALSGSSDQTVRLWDCHTGQQLRSFLGHRSGIKSVAFSPDGKWALSGSHDNTLRLWDCHTGQRLRSFLGHTNSVYSVAFSPDGKWALSGSYDKTVRLWNCHTGRQVHSFLGHSKGVTSVAFSPDGKWALSGSSDNTVRLWDCQTGQELRSFLRHKHYVTSVAFSPDGYWALSGSDDKTVRLWDCHTGREIHCLALGFDIQRVRFLPDGKEILIATHEPALKRWTLFDEQGHFHPMLKWSTASAALSAQNLNLEGAKDLSEPNQRLLIQHGATNNE